MDASRPQPGQPKLRPTRDALGPSLACTCSHPQPQGHLSQIRVVCSNRKPRVLVATNETPVGSSRAGKKAGGLWRPSLGSPRVLLGSSVLRSLEPVWALEVCTCLTTSRGCPEPAHDVLVCPLSSDMGHPQDRTQVCSCVCPPPGTFPPPITVMDAGPAHAWYLISVCWVAAGMGGWIEAWVDGWINRQMSG